MPEQDFEPTTVSATIQAGGTSSKSPSPTVVWKSLPSPGEPLAMYCSSNAWSIILKYSHKSAKPGLMPGVFSCSQENTLSSGVRTTVRVP
eukprot:120102-Lingulodinium_polyedra.AAC.1